MFFRTRCGLHTAANIKVGDSVKFSHRFNQDDVCTFAKVSGDHNPIHTDKDAAVKTGLFHGPIVHGALLNGFVSGILGTKFPGTGTILVSQELRFPKPLYVDEAVEAVVTVASMKKKFVDLEIRCTAIERGTDATVLLGKVTVLLGHS